MFASNVLLRVNFPVKIDVYKSSCRTYFSFKLGFRNDVERFIDQYLKLFSTYSDHPVYCNYIRPHKPPAAITLNQESNGNRPRKRSNRSRKEPYSRARQPSTPRAPKRQKENKPRAPRVKTGRKRGPYKKSSKVLNFCSFLILLMFVLKSI